MRPLPVLAALTHAFNSVWHNSTVAIRISWLWYAILAVVLAAGGQFLSAQPAIDPQSPSLDAHGLALELVIVLIVLLANSSIAVRWHRYILLDEISGSFQVLRFDGKVWRYFGNTLLIMLVLAICTLP